MTSTAPRPLFLAPRPVPRPWGGRRVASRYGWDGGDARIGEWWLASSYPGTETALRDLHGDLAAWLDGPGRAAGCPSSGAFPLLLKFLDCGDVLSAQVHPDDETAARWDLPRGKTEAWHVLDTDPGSGVYLGLAEGVSAERFFDAVQAGAGDDDVAAMLHFVEVAPGDTFHVAAGTVHAVGGGLSLFEVQQNSDTTHRIHDWGRGRDVHLADARISTHDVGPVGPVDVSAAAVDDDGWTRLVDDPAFVLRHARVAPGAEQRAAPGAGRGYAIVTVLAGAGRLTTDAGDHALRDGDTAILFEPFALSAERELDVVVCDPPRD